MPLSIYTARLGCHDPDTLNITRMSAGPEGLPFAPSWDLLNQFKPKQKAGTLTPADWEDFKAAYIGEMRWSYRAHRAAWDVLLARPRVVLVCYEPAGEHCHRLILADLLIKAGAVYHGELPAKAEQDPRQLGLLDRK